MKIAARLATSPLAQSAVSAAARSAASTLALLPSGMTRRLVEAFPSERAFVALQAAGRKCHVSYMGVVGDYGTIEGSIDDTAIMQWYATRGSWRTTEADFFTDLFAANREGTFIDIGANIGLTTIPIARNPNVFCKAFEPEPRTFQYLSRNIAANCSTANVELFNFALFDRDVMLELKLSPMNKGDNRVNFAGRNEHAEKHLWEVVMVPGKPLDEVLNLVSLPRPLCVKLSGQGVDKHILLGGKSVLGQASAMTFDFCPFILEEQGSDYEPLLRFCGEQFQAGAVMRGRDEHDPDWQRTDVIVATLRRLLQPGAAGEYDFFRVLFSKGTTARS
jgi:FkbM family methyltransferase